MRLGGSSLSNVAPFQTEALLLWLEPDANTVDVDTNMTVTSRDPARRTFTGTGAAQPDFAASEPTGNDAPALSFTGADVIVSDDPASTWALFNDGSGVKAKVAFLAQPSVGGQFQVLLSTRTIGDGAQFVYDADNEHVEAFIRDQTGTLVGSAATPNGSVPNGTIAIVTIVVRNDGNGPDLSIECCDVIATDDGIVFDSSGTPATTLTIGSAGGSNFLEGHVFAAIVWSDPDADSDERAEHYLRDKLFCELGVPGCFIYARADRGLTLDGSDIDAIADQSGNANNFTAAVGAESQLSVPTAALGGRPASSSTGAGERASVDVSDVFSGEVFGTHEVCVTGRFVTADGPLFSLGWIGASTEDRHAVSINGSGNWEVTILDSDIDESIDTGVQADTDVHTFSFARSPSGVSLRIDEALLLDDVGTSFAGSNEGGATGYDLTLHANQDGTTESQSVIGRVGFFGALTDYQRSVVQWAQRKWARLAQLQSFVEASKSLGATFIGDPASATLSGSTVTAIDNLATGEAMTVVGSPQYSDTSFDGRPGITLDGNDWFEGIDFGGAFDGGNTWLAMYEKQNAVADASGNILTAEATGGAFAILRQSNVGDGREAFLYDPDGGGSTGVNDTDGSSDVAPRLHEWFTPTATTVTHRKDNAATGVTGVAFSLGSAVFDLAGGWGVRPSNSGSPFVGVLGRAAVFPTVPSEFDRARLRTLLEAL